MAQSHPLLQNHTHSQWKLLFREGGVTPRPQGEARRWLMDMGGHKGLATLPVG